MPETILVVDSQRHYVRILSDCLTGAGYQVITAYSGQEALLKAKRENPDLITLELDLPDTDGLEVLHQLKGNPVTAEIPVIVITIRESDAQAGWGAGNDAFLTKPVDIRDVRNFTERILAHKKKDDGS